MTTPMMQQYRDAKAQHPDKLLLFRMGDFYELFETDAEAAAKQLGLTLTSRDKSMPMAGFPHHQLDAYLRKLLKSGQRVAICDQVEDASEAKGLVRREVTRVVTPGTLTEQEMLDPLQPNHLMAVCPSGKSWPSSAVAIAWLDLSTGHFHAADFSADRWRHEAARVAPAECLCPESFAEQIANDVRTALPNTSIAACPDWTFDHQSATACLHHHFGVQTLAGFGFDDGQRCLAAAGAVLLYVKENLKAELAHIRRLLPYRLEDFLLLDDVTRRSLELTHTMRDGERQGSLLSVLDRTVTPMGARMLRDWLVAPLADRGQIESRLDAVEEAVGNHTLRRELREGLNEVSDLHRLTTRVSTRRAAPRDLAAVARTLQSLPRIKAKVTARQAALYRHLESQLELCADLRELLDRAMVDEPPQTSREGGVIRPGYDADLDELRQIARGGKEWIANYQAEETKRTNIPSLKVGFNKVFGYYIEITHAHATKVPSEYQRKQTLKNAERYITPELKEFEEKVLSADEKSHKREHDLFLEIRERVAEQTDRLLQTADVLATLDVATSLAELAVAGSYTRPNLTDDAKLEITDGRHPVLDQTLPPGTFVPNDVHVDCDAGRLWLITGPNMSGKSTFIRQVALLTLMTQMGSFIPAKVATVGLVDRIFTRVGASDELSRGHSTFMVEMTEAANILNNATDRSLVILDEIGRGTSTYDGVSLAWAITEYLHNQVGCRALFATHYHELAQLAETLPHLRNYNVQVREYEDDVVFLHKIEAGSADKSYGIHVARLAGIPGDVLDRAREVLTELESHHLDEELPKPPRKKRKTPEEQPGLFDGK